MRGLKQHHVLLFMIFHVNTEQLYNEKLKDVFVLYAWPGNILHITRLHSPTC